MTTSHCTPWSSTVVSVDSQLQGVQRKLAGGGWAPATHSSASQRLGLAAQGGNSNGQHVPVILLDYLDSASDG